MVKPSINTYSVGKSIFLQDWFYYQTILLWKFLFSNIQLESVSHHLY